MFCKKDYMIVANCDDQNLYKYRLFRVLHAYAASRSRVDICKLAFRFNLHEKDSSLNATAI